MRLRRTSRRILLLPAVVTVTGLLLAGCGGSSPAKTHSSSSPPASPPSAGTSSAESQIKANWEAFFSSSTPVSKRVALLQHGSVFAPLIAAQAKSSLASSASATVTKVEDVTATRATVIYSIDVSGTPALSNQKGVAVYQDGTWQVGLASFCGLLQLEKTSGLVKLPSVPAACSSAT